MRKVTINTFITAIKRRNDYYVNGQKFTPPADAVIEPSKDEITEKDCTLIAFHDCCESFTVMTLVNFAQSLFMEARQEHVMDGTILRRLRELREDDIINYKMVMTDHFIYGKVRSVNHYVKLPVPEKAIQEQIKFTR